MLQSWLVPKVNEKINQSIYAIEKLPIEILNQLQEEYVYNKNKDINDDIINQEAIISTVFNQLKSPTYYYPISNKLMKTLEDVVIQMTSRIWNISITNLEITSSYGIREYRDNAIISWHTDPPLTQPLTAIIHIDHGKSNNNNNNDNDNNNKWEIQIAKISIESQVIDIDNIVLDAGDVLILESGSLPHARINALHDDYYGNCFVHLREKGWSLPINDL
jgi:hypothetical protein